MNREVNVIEPSEIDINTLKALLDYDPLTGIFRWKQRPHPWSRARAGDEAGSSERPYRRVMVQKKHYSLHRLAFAFLHGFAPTVVDHKDGDTWNNRADNLREATHRQNQQNKKVLRTSGTGLKGVRKSRGVRHVTADGKIVYYQRSKPYYSLIRVKGKRRYLGSFATAEEAAAAYERCAQQHFGEFARV